MGKALDTHTHSESIVKLIGIMPGAGSKSLTYHDPLHVIHNGSMEALFCTDKCIIYDRTLIHYHQNHHITHTVNQSW